MEKIKTFEQLMNEMAAVMRIDHLMVGYKDDYKDLIFIIDPDFYDMDDIFDEIELEEYIKGAINLKWNDKLNCMEVDSAWARHGYGPILYLLTSTIVNGPIVPHQTMDKLSKEAMNVWVNFMEGGKGDHLMDSWPQKYPRHVWTDTDDPRRYYFETKRRIKYDRMPQDEMFEYVHGVASELLRAYIRSVRY
jgi:hypothetical protein